MTNTFRKKIYYLNSERLEKKERRERERWRQEKGEEKEKFVPVKIKSENLFSKIILFDKY